MLIFNAQIYTMSGGIIENGYISFENGKISAVGEMSDQNFEKNANSLDLKGKMLFPGFVDSHTHLGVCGDSLGFEGDDLNEMCDPVTPHISALDAVNPFDACFKEALEAGITAVVTGPGSSNPIAGQLIAIKTYGSIVDEMIIKSPAAMKFSLGENPKTTYHERKETPSSRMTTASIIREHLKKSRQYMQKKEAGDDYEYDEIYESLIPVLKGELTAHFHAHRTDDISTAIRLSKEFSLNYVIVHGTGASLAVDYLRKNSAGIMCGPLICERSKPELQGLSLATPGFLSREGIKISIISDHPCVPINLLNVCAGLAVREGLDYYEALKAITINAAELAGISDRVGSIEVGKDADFVVFEGDPLSISAKPEMVIVDGEIRYSK